MARYDQEHKDATRRRIVGAAGRRFKRDGFDGSGIAALMADAGLTNGAFYAHFDSKDDLVTAVVSEELRFQAETFRSLDPGLAGLEQLVRGYLSAEHHAHTDAGCPSAALLDEIARAPEATKQAYTAGTHALLDEIAGRLTPDDPAASYGRAQGLFTMIVGTLQLARAAATRELADWVLRNGLQSALEVIDPGDAPSAR